MTIIHKVPMLRITGCSDFMMWYRDMTGQLVPHLGWSELHGYKSRDANGHTNFIHSNDAEPATVHVHTNELAHWPFNHYMHLADGMRKSILLTERPNRAWPRIVEEIEKAKHSGSSGEPVMGQTRSQSLIETAANVITGWLLALVITGWLFPSMALIENALITSIFTSASLVRSYAVRRYFNRIQSQKS